MGSLDWLYGAQVFGIKLGLETSARLLSHLPVAPPATIIHVAGTNGKGSVCAFADAIARAHGFRTGLFTSPHLLRFEERIRIDGVPIPGASLDRILNHLRDLVHDWDPHPTFFELALSAAMFWFCEQQTTCIILETGMGGRLDATNAVTPIAASVLTPVDLDHSAWLGTTLAEIAAEKAGIIRPGIPVVSSVQHPEVWRVIERVARERAAPLRLVDLPLQLPLALAGSHQKSNAALARAALQAAGVPLDPGALSAAVRSVSWPGRFQLFETQPAVVVDGAHNPAAAAVLARAWRETFPAQKATLLFGALRDKDVPSMLTQLQPLAERIFLVPIRDTDRGLDAAALHEHAPQARAFADCASALAAARLHREPVLVTGSLYLAGEALRVLNAPSEVPTQPQ
ncbi:MAG TPA: folylpolyglutamate synthase/dihydrofolate synthase family protein [Verrucomicrobiales bacterium]|nr:folylpolyglutamate synthase/dihydrofolate synthase family protein [Verrucomicrobiales bacterium]